MSVQHLYSRSGAFDYFREFEPVAMARYSIYIYHITPDAASRVRRELGLPELSGPEQPGGEARDEQDAGE